MHVLSWLSANGTAAIVEFPGVFYRGGAEQKIRRYLVTNNYIDTVIQLPPNLFFGTPISTCIVVLKKNKADNRICFIDAAQDFGHEGNKNILRPEDIERIYAAHVAKRDETGYSRVVTVADVEKENFNLSVSTYVERPDTRERVDIRELNRRIGEIVAREEQLRREIDRIVSELAQDEEATE